MKQYSILAVVAMVGTITGCSGSKLEENSPDGAVRTMQQSILANRPEQIFKGLPASYQSDIDALVADAVDPREPS